MGFKFRWARAGDPIKGGGRYGEEGRPYFYVQWSLNEGHQFRAGPYGWQLREKAGKVQLHAKPFDYWSTIGDVDALTFGELYAGCIKRYLMNAKELKQAEGEYKPKRRTKATLPTTRTPHQGTPPSVGEVLAGARRAPAPKLTPAQAGAAKLMAKKTDGAASFANRWHVYFVADGDHNLVGRRKTRGGAEVLASTLALKHRQPTIYGWQIQPRNRVHGDVRTSTTDLKAPHFRIEG